MSVYGNPLQMGGGGGIIVPKQITANGTYDAAMDDADGYNPVQVNVSGGGTIISKTITANGTYNALSDNANGYSPVIVSVGENWPALPAEYQEVQYMTHTKHAGFAVTIPSSFRVETKAEWAGTSGENVILGYRVNSSTQRDFELRVVDQGQVNLWMRYIGGSDPSLSFTVEPNVPFIFRGFMYGMRANAYIGLYATYSSSVYSGWDGKIYYIKGWDAEGNPSFKFVPCYRKADNTPGYYEVVNGTFYSTLLAYSGGTIALGPDAA